VDTAGDAERLWLLAACCLSDGVFAAPQGQVAGIDALSASMILAAPEQLEGVLGGHVDRG
jgi:hypothetical protein